MSKILSLLTKYTLLIIIITACNNTKRDYIVDNYAFGKIEFGVSPQIFNDQIVKLLDSLPKSGSYYKVGDFLFNNIAPEYYKNELVRISLSGYKYQNISLLNDAAIKIEEQFNDKYGKSESIDNSLNDELFEYSSIVNGKRWYTSDKNILIKFLKAFNGYEIIIISENTIGAIDQEREKSLKEREVSNQLKNTL